MKVKALTVGELQGILSGLDPNMPISIRKDTISTCMSREPEGFSTCDAIGELQLVSKENLFISKGTGPQQDWVTIILDTKLDPNFYPMPLTKPQLEFYKRTKWQNPYWTDNYNHIIEGLQINYSDRKFAKLEVEADDFCSTYYIDSRTIESQSPMFLKLENLNTLVGHGETHNELRIWTGDPSEQRLLSS